MAIRLYRPGDKVRVREDLRPGVDYAVERGGPECRAHGNMFDYRGEVVTIYTLTSHYRYLIEELPSPVYKWTDDMFVGWAES